MHGVSLLFKAFGTGLRLLFTRQHRLPQRSAVIGSMLLLLVGAAGSVPAQDSPPSGQSSPTGKAPKPHVGSAMAVLATLEQAQVLPPDNTPAANQVIKSVIQFQSAFARSEDRFVHDFATRALAGTYGDRAAGVLAHMQSTGWTAPLLEALAEAEAQASPEELAALASGFHRFNLSPNDFHQFMQLVRSARGALEKQGTTFQRVFASHRQMMPGANVQQ